MNYLYKKNVNTLFFALVIMVMYHLCYANSVNHRTFLQHLYYTKSGALIRTVITKQWFSKLTGWYCNTSLSRIHIHSFVKKHAININEASKPLHKYSSFNEFFTRKLKPYTRPIDHDSTSIISPIDGFLFIKSWLNKQTKFVVKEKAFNLKTFLQNEWLADYFKNGTIMIFYLSPGDYHRFHFPIDTVPTKPKKIKGNFESVNPLVYHSNVEPLVENERHLILLQTNTNEYVAFIPVGALCVGRITETYIPGNFYVKGDEAGYFSFGGSTIVLIFPEQMINCNPRLPMEHFTPIKMGTKIGIFIK